MLLKPIFNYDAIYDCFTCMRADRHIGNEGYFAENLEDFSRHGSCHRGRLAGIRPESSRPFIPLVGGERVSYRYFYPLSEVFAADAPAPSDIEAPAAADADDSVEPFATPFDFPAPALKGCSPADQLAAFLVTFHPSQRIKDRHFCWSFCFSRY